MSDEARGEESPPGTPDRPGARPPRGRVWGPLLRGRRRLRGGHRRWEKWLPAADWAILAPPAEANLRAVTTLTA